MQACTGFAERECTIVRQQTKREKSAIYLRIRPKNEQTRPD